MKERVAKLLGEMIASDKTSAEYKALAQESTGLEALFGFLYLTGQNERIGQLVNYIKEVNPDA